MVQHKFKVGQLVNFTPTRPGVPTSDLQYQVLQLLPAEASALQYRIKSKSESFERVAKESELSRRTPS